MTIITAIVSPSARPKAIIAPATMPGRIAGKMILTRVISREKPRLSTENLWNVEKSDGLHRQKAGKKRVFGNLYAERVEKGSAKADF